MKSALAVLAGYLVFAISAVLLFQLSGVDPHLVPGLGFIIGSILYGMAFAALGGYIAAVIARGRELAHAAAVACILAIFAFVSIIAQPGLSSHWSQLAAIFLMAPAAVGGGWMRRKQRSAKNER